MNITDEYGCVYSSDGKLLLEINEELETYTIKQGTEQICDSAFDDCSSLQSVVIPDSVTKIGWSAFRGCSSLQSIVIPDSITTIGDYAFFLCSSLQSIVIPDSVKKLGNLPFPLGIELISKSDRYVVEDDLLIDLEEKRLIQTFKDKEYINIPNTIAVIDSEAFADCSSLQSIVIPNSVTTIGDCFFDDYSSLQSIIIPKGKREYFEQLLKEYHNDDLIPYLKEV